MTVLAYLRHLWRSRFRVMPLSYVRELEEEHAWSIAALQAQSEDRRKVLAMCHGYLRSFPGTGAKRREITENLRKKIERVAP